MTIFRTLLLLSELGTVIAFCEFLSISISRSASEAFAPIISLLSAGAQPRDNSSSAVGTRIAFLSGEGECLATIGSSDTSAALVLALKIPHSLEKCPP
jgi:hypothetical protein